MVSNLQVFALAVIFLPAFAVADVFVPTYAEEKAAVVQDETLTFITHASSYYDRDSQSKAGVEALVRYSRQQRIPIYAAVDYSATTDAKAAAKYFASPEAVTQTVLSQGGYHNLLFPKLKKVLIAGGHLPLCLCETMRDLVRGVRAYNTSHLEIILVRDAIYSAASLAYAMMLDGFVKTYILPGFTCFQNHFDHPHPDLAGYSLRVSFDNVFLKEYEFSRGNKKKRKLIAGEKIVKNDSHSSGTIEINVISSSLLGVESLDGSP